MSEADSMDGRAREEASAWFAKLNKREVSLSDLEAFRVWRDDAGNRAAYAEIERLWRRAGELQARPDINQAVGQALARRRARPPRRGGRTGWAVGAAFALASLGGAVAVWIYVQAHPSFTTKVGEQRLVQLPDGSSVRLDTDSRVDVAFSHGERRLRLERGQAFFDVAHDAARPFLVNAGPVTIKAIGTRFDVRRDGPTPTVTLVQGVVQVRRDTGQTWTLQAGQQITPAPAAAPRPANLDAATSWTDGRVVFQGLPLSSAVAEVNRYAVHKIRLQAPAVAGVPVTGSFQTGDAAAFANAVAHLHDLRARKLTDGTIVLDPNPTATQ
jgi:transmembrane sensor